MKRGMVSTLLRATACDHCPQPCSGMPIRLAEEPTGIGMGKTPHRHGRSPALSPRGGPQRHRSHPLSRGGGYRRPGPADEGRGADNREEGRRIDA